MNLNKALQHLYEILYDEETREVNVSKLLVAIHDEVTGVECDVKNNHVKIVESMAVNWPDSHDTTKRAPVNMVHALQHLYKAITGEDTRQTNISKLLVMIEYAITGEYPDIKNNWGEIIYDMATKWPFEWPTEKLPYFFRQSGGALNSRLLNKEKDCLVGASVPWNQLANLVRTSGRGITFSMDTNGVVSLGGTAEGSYATPYADTDSVANHKYLVSTTLLANPNNVSINFGFLNVAIRAALGQSRIINAPSSTHSTVGIEGFSANTDLSGVKYTAYFIDLTLLFGSTIADYLYTLESGTSGAGVSKLKEWGFLTEPFYQFDNGSLQSVNATKKICVGFNQWDEEWELGQFNNSTGQPLPSNDCIRSKNYISVMPSTTYYTTYGGGYMQVFFYTADETFISQTWVGVNNLISTPSGCGKMKFRNASAYGTTYNHDICINISNASLNGQYQPYEAHSYDLADLDLRGVFKMDASHNIYAEGDTYEASGKVTRYWSERAYEEGDVSDYETMITDGTRTIYKLTTPTIETVTGFTNPQSVDKYGTEQYIDGKVASGTRDVAVPVGHQTEYKCTPTP